MRRPLRLAALRLALTSGVLALYPLAAPAQDGEWHLLANSPENGYRFEDASFLSPAHGWIVSGSGGGETWRTLDGGATWSLMSSVPDYLRAVAFVSPSHGWIGALYGPRRLYETTDAGATLVDVSARISPAIGGGICGLWAFDESRVVGVGQWNGPAYLIRTDDGGATWQSRDLSALARSLIDIVFLDDLRGFIVGGTAGPAQGGRVVILATEDGGATWAVRFTGSPPPAGQGEWAWKVSFPTPEVGFVSVEQWSAPTTGKVIRTTDGGLTWTEVAVPGAGSMQGIGFINAQRGWLSGRGVAMETTDGGTTWTPTSAIDGAVNRFEFFDGELGYAMGRRIFAIDTRTTTAAPAPPGAVTALDPVVPNPARGAATLRYRLAESGAVELALYDALGRRVAVLAEGPAAAGVHEVRWDGRDASGARAAPGTYLARLRAGGKVHTRPFAFAP